MRDAIAIVIALMGVMLVGRAIVSWIGGKGRPSDHVGAFIIGIATVAAGLLELQPVGSAIGENALMTTGILGVLIGTVLEVRAEKRKKEQAPS